jgi:hypothetical protein
VGLEKGHLCLRFHALRNEPQLEASAAAIVAERLKLKESSGLSKTVQALSGCLDVRVL